jgi:TRAP-type C4-dicarboxylate transport system permease small subunit
MMWPSLQRISEAIALVGGLLLVAVALMVTASVAIRSPLVGGAGVPGDFELVQMGTAVAAFSYLALCQARRGNIFVDTFTGWLPRRAQAGIDALWDIAYALAMAVIAWRLLVGALGERASGTTTMVLGLPTWPAIGLCGLLAAFVALVAVVGAAARFTAPAPPQAPEESPA